MPGAELRTFCDVVYITSTNQRSPKKYVPHTVDTASTTNKQLNLETKKKKIKNQFRVS